MYVNVLSLVVEKLNFPPVKKLKVLFIAKELKISPIEEL